LIAGVLVFGALVTPGANAVKDDTTLVSRASSFGPVGDGRSFIPSISADGRFVAFSSDADNLDAASNDTVYDVFVRDLQANTTTLVSRATGAAGVVGDGGSFSPSISPDGRFVAFESGATNLDTESNDVATDVFVRDLQANTTTLVSRATGATGVVGDRSSSAPSISADGRYVAFASIAGNLGAGSDDLVSDVFVRDLLANTTTLASRATGATGEVGGGEYGSFAPSISADGRLVAFRSDADNLDNESDLFNFDVFVRDLLANTTTLVSRATGASGVVANNDSFEPSISAGGRYVAFSSYADNLDAASNDGVSDVFVRDLLANTTTLASRATGASGVVGDNWSSAPSISADGRYVAFDSDADNLDAASNDTVRDVFVRDLRFNTTTLASRATGATGVVGDGFSVSPSITADGRYVAFSSDADNLDAASNDTVEDVFVRDVFGPQPAPALLINDVSLREGRSGTTSFTFTVRLRGVTYRTVTVDFFTDDGTAVAPSDYEFTNGTLSFAPGEHAKTIVVPVVGDRLRERNETFEVILQDAQGAPITDGTGVGTIRADEPRRRR
jgi:Tol biopolymer transport system component